MKSVFLRWMVFCLSVFGMLSVSRMLGIDIGWKNISPLRAGEPVGQTPRPEIAGTGQRGASSFLAAVPSGRTPRPEAGEAGKRASPALLAAASAGQPPGFQGVFNGSFEQDRDGDGVPDGWATAGRRGVVQKLTQFADPQRGKVARLQCTQFEPGFPDSHAMLAQYDRVAVQRGQWYQVRLWAKAEDFEAGAVSISLVNRRQWASAGLEESVCPSDRWEEFTFFFQAHQNLRAEDSRLQIWFTGTGTLYLDDVAITPLQEFRLQRQPLLVWPQQGGNILPNSSFECGGAGWGCFAPDVPSWGGALFDRLGQLDRHQAYHGQHSWRLSLRREELPVSYFDYFDPSAAPLGCVVLAHEGWVLAEVGKTYRFSAYVRSEPEGLPGLVLIRHADGPQLSERFTGAAKWTKVEYSFTAQRPFFWAGLGVDLRQGNHPGGTLWIDAVCLSPLRQSPAEPKGRPDEGPDRSRAVPSTLPPAAQGRSSDSPSASARPPAEREKPSLFSSDSPPGQAPDYQPRQGLESAVETDRIGNIFTDPGAGLAFRLRAYNDARQDALLTGQLTIADYLDQPVWQEQVKISVPAGQAVQEEWTGLLAGRQGFFRIRWRPADGEEQSLRVAAIQPYPAGQDSPFGMNHAFSWEFLLRLGQQAGLCWWRDWSCQWRLVQPAAGAPFDFSIPDGQILRVLRAGGRVLLLLPFPSAPWATQADLKKVRSQTQGNDYLFRRTVAAMKPHRMEPFAEYVRQTVRHYQGRITAIEILNEPLSTTYALPASFGYTTADYIEMLRTAYQAAKAVDPNCLVVGGIGAGPDHRFVREFIEQDGLRWCDGMDLHMYPHAGPPDAYEKAYQECWQRMQARGQARPIWITELGIYADDDPAALPPRAGDATMNRSQRPNELRAAADLVKFAAILGSAGVRKIFYHAGTCGVWNESSAGNVFFEYGGRPRKMYPAQAVLSRLLGPEFTFVQKWTEPADLQAFQFRSGQRQVVILWSRRGEKTISPPEGFAALDLMGNPISTRPVPVGYIPVYLVK